MPHFNLNIETGLLILESVLLIATIILLIYSIREGKNRKNLLLELGKATKVLTRQEYFLTVIDSLMDSKLEVVGCITGSPPSGDDRRMTRDIMETINKITKRGVRVSYLMPKFPDRLQIGYQYTKAGAEIRYSSCLMVHNIRFIIIDDMSVVIGIPESTGEKEATRKGYRIPSEGLASVLKEHFNKCEKQLTYEEYVREIIKQTGGTPKILARELQIDEEEIIRLS